jgi:hypothetical protein
MESFDKLSDVEENNGTSLAAAIPLTQVDDTKNVPANNLYKDPAKAPAELGDNSNNDLLVYMPISSMNDKTAFNFSKTNIMFVIIIILLIFILFIYMNDIPKLPNIFLY